MRFSQRLPPDLTPSALSASLAERGELLDLTVSNPTQVGLTYDEATIRAALAPADVLLYDPQPLGSREARQAVVDYAARLGRRLSVNRLALTASTSEAYAVLCKLLCDAGDTVAVATPSYPLVPHLAELEGVRTLSYTLGFAERWRIDLASLEQALLAGAHAVVVVSPNNPTGSVPDAQEARHVRALCRRYDAALIIDEVFGPYGNDGALPTLGCDDGPLTFVLDGLSKGAALPQLKLGWIATYGEPSVVQEAMLRLEWLLDAFLSVSAPVQVGASLLLSTALPMQAQIRARLRRNRAALAEALRGASARVLPADGGWYALVALEGGADEEQVVVDLAAQAHVLVQPGYFYDFVAGSHLVVSLLARPDVFLAGVTALSRALPELLSQEM